MHPDRLLERARKIPERIASSLDPIMNRNTMLTFGGIFSFIGLGLAAEVLYSNGVDFGLPRGHLRFAILLPALPIFKGVLGDAKEYFFSGEILELSKSGDDMRKMGFAGFSMHSAGEYSQGLAILLGGPDFAANWPGSDLNAFLFDPHNIPYWSLNVPGFFLIGKAAISGLRDGVNRIRTDIQTLRSIINTRSNPENRE